HRMRGTRTAPSLSRDGAVSRGLGSRSAGSESDQQVFLPAALVVTGEHLRHVELSVREQDLRVLGQHARLGVAHRLRRRVAQQRRLREGAAVDADDLAALVVRRPLVRDHVGAVHAQRGQRVAVAGVGALSGLLPGGQVEGDDLVGVAVLAGALVLLGGDVQLVLAHGEPRALLDLGDAVAAGRVVVAGGGDAGAQLAGLVVDGEEVGDAAAVAGGVADVGGHDQRVGGHDARVLDALAHLVLGDHLPGLRVDGLDVQLALGVRAALAHGDQLRAAAVAGVVAGVGRLGRPQLLAAADLPGGAAAGAAGGDGVTADGDVVEADRAG